MGNLIVAYPDGSLQDAVIRMLENDVGRLLVVDKSNPGRLAGDLGRAEALNARKLRIRDESHREQGWLHAFRLVASRTQHLECVNSSDSSSYSLSPSLEGDTDKHD